MKAERKEQQKETCQSQTSKMLHSNKQELLIEISISWFTSKRCGKIFWAISATWENQDYYDSLHYMKHNIGTWETFLEPSRRYTMAKSC